MPVFTLLSNVGHPNVISVFLSKRKKLHTTRSWGFLELERDGRVPKDSLMNQGKYGEGVIIANIDTGNILNLSVSLPKLELMSLSLFLFVIEFRYEPFICWLTPMRPFHFIGFQVI